MYATPTRRKLFQVGLVVLFFLVAPQAVKAADPALFGTWSFDQTGYGGATYTSSLALKPDGSFSMTTSIVPSGYSYRTWGTYTASGGVMSMNVTGWSPKTDPSGRPFQPQTFGQADYEFL
jgi:hypothetical protein